MKVILVKGIGDTNVMYYGEIEKPIPGPDDLLVKIHAAALNRCDIIQRQGLYKVPPSNSDILGIEVAGEVEVCGKNVTKFQPGDKVFGYVNGGGYAEYCLQDQYFAHHLPTGWDYSDGAAVAEVFQTANESLFTHGNLQKNETVLLHAGASGVGLAGIQMAKHIGVKTIVTVGTDAKAKFCEDIGADLAINYRSTDFVQKVLRFTQNKGVDLVIDCVGPDYLAKNIKCLKLDGRLILIGLLSGTTCGFDFIPFIAKRINMKGHNTRARELPIQREIAKRFHERWLPLMAQGIIRPTIDRIFPIEQVAQAHQFMEENKNIGKIILTI